MSATEAPPPWPALLKRLAIWGGFFFLIYLTRDFFFLAFMTFMFSYLALAVVGRGVKRLSPHAEKPGLRRLLTLAVFVLGPLTLLGVGALVMPRLVEQAERFAGWVSHLSPEAEVAHLLEGYVGRSGFAQEYGGPDDPRYRKALEEFRATGARYVAAYNQFPKLEAWVEGGFAKRFAEAERGRTRARLAAEGTSSREFERWFTEVKFPQLPDDDRKGGAAATLRQARRDPAALGKLQAEWIDDAVARGLAAARSSPAYREQFRADYEARREQSPGTLPYAFEQYEALQKARPHGPKAFAEVMDALHLPGEAEGEERVRADFEADKRHDIFQAWWATSTPAKFVRQRIETGANGDVAAHAERMLSSLLNVPLDLTSALLLSFFICIDFPALKRAVRQLRDTWLRDVYDEMAPALSSLALLVGRAMQAQGMIAACNATVLFLALTVLGVEHAVLLAGAVFVFCLVPTIGTILAWVLLVAVALVQPGGGFGLALKVSGAVVLVVLLETFVFSPRILGKLMELHPVLIFAILPLGQYFFGVWGLILATPVAVYVVYEVILRRGLPGIDEPPIDVARHDAPISDSH